MKRMNEWNEWNKCVCKTNIQIESNVDNEQSLGKTDYETDQVIKYILNERNIIYTRNG